MELLELHLVLRSYRMATRLHYHERASNRRPLLVQLPIDIDIIVYVYCTVGHLHVQTNSQESPRLTVGPARY